MTMIVRATHATAPAGTTRTLWKAAAWAVPRTAKLTKLIEDRSRYQALGSVQTLRVAVLVASLLYVVL